ncbi:ATP-binding protein [Zobellia galactanivorans]|uniref:ATP-binding protein n=1 Tax=Zobellia galactanivorans (strain DSM 12802 / CCUG 47099 / CIP 106680 / NCIMB 13871 / Dsij) TaxID=63186 RepID=UPI0026E42102|nr:ATP-binding protein [Zobellia galactanivorans]MDO6808119.1 ATP-binding protein [Zobellia galactanivorans]
MKITAAEKKRIANAALAYADRYDSRNQAAATLNGVSSATLSQVINGNWSQISDKMWRTIMASLSFNPDEETFVETSAFSELQEIFEDAQENALTMGIIAPAGTGKTFAIKYHYATSRNVFFLQCREYWNRKVFLQELLTKMGRPHFGMSIAEMMAEAERRLLMIDSPQIILDEYDKLPDHVFSFFITMYNGVEGRCSFIVIATDHLKKRIKRGVELNKKGYNEIWSRLGRKFIEIPAPNAEDIVKICHVFGIDDTMTIRKVIADSENDLRRVMRKIHAIKAKQAKAELNQ